ncbi:MAG: hypothetical protein AMXMBFR84_05020 [Candidatus Hydrogenedentota bacterium]
MGSWGSTGVFELLPNMHYWPRTYIQTGCTAFVVAALGTPLAIFVLRRLGIMDTPGDHRIHDRPIPRGGGIIIFIAFAVAVLLPNYRDNPMKGVMLSAFICLVIGFLDDWRGGVPAVLKLATLALVTFIMYSYGVSLRIFPWASLNVLFTLIWMVGVTSAFNGLDNMDGLATGVASIASAMYFIIALQTFLIFGRETDLSWFGLLAAGLIGANLGFLIYNFKPARIFMGDAGSFFLGYMLAALGVMGQWTLNPIIAVTIPVLILGVPLFDFTYILVARIMRGETRTLYQVITHSAPDHLSHRLVWMGFSQRKAVLFIYLISFALGVSGILLRNASSLVDNALALFQGFAIVAIVIGLMATATRRHLANGAK